MKIGAKTLKNNFGMKATANEMDMATIRMAKPNVGSLLIGEKGERFRGVVVLPNLFPAI